MRSPEKSIVFLLPLLNPLPFPFHQRVDILDDGDKKKAVEVLFPLRKHHPLSKEEARNYFGLTHSQDQPTLLVFGGSQGAAHLNQLFLRALKFLPQLQILHFTGNETSAEEARKVYHTLGLKACVKAFESRIDLAMQIADCAIVRAGAATVCELIEYELPALLVPYPYAKENHQEKNGQHFISIIKGGKMYKESELDAPLLAHCILQILAETQLLRGHISTYKRQNRSQPLSVLVKKILE